MKRTQTMTKHQPRCFAGSVICRSSQILALLLVVSLGAGWFSPSLLNPRLPLTGIRLGAKRSATARPSTSSIVGDRVLTGFSGRQVLLILGWPRVALPLDLILRRIGRWGPAANGSDNTFNPDSHRRSGDLLP